MNLSTISYKEIFINKNGNKTKNNQNVLSLFGCESSDQI